MNTQTQRSIFVTVVAWIFIILSAWHGISGVLMGVMMVMMVSLPEVSTAPDAPPAAAFAIFLIVFLMISAAGLTSAISLLKRKNWARILFIVFMILGALACAAMLVMYGVMLLFMLEAADEHNMQAMFVTMVVGTMVMLLVFSGLFAWIAKRLMSSAIAAEFHPVTPSVIQAPVNPASQRSLFVTVVAWIFIVFSSGYAFLSIFQSIMMISMFSSPEFSAAWDAMPQDMPSFPAFISSHFYLLGFFMLFASVTVLVSSIGLLRRKNWARIVFIGCMILSALGCIVMPVIQGVMFTSMRKTPVFPSDMPGAMEPVFMVMIGVALVFFLGIAGLFGWIAKRLMSSAIVAEFRPEKTLLLQA